MSKVKLSLRPAGDQDSRLLWRWRNEPSGLKSYFSAKPVSWGVHQKWFSAKRRDPRCRLFVLESQRKPVGQIRVEISRRGVGEIHIGLDKQARGRGFGSEGIVAVTGRVFESGSARSFVAHVKPDNLPSVVAFLKAGFRFRKWARVKGVPCYQLSKSGR